MRPRNIALWRLLCFTVSTGFPLAPPQMHIILVLQSCLPYVIDSRFAHEC